MIEAMTYHADSSLVEAIFSGILTDIDVKMYYAYVQCSVPAGSSYDELINYLGLTGCAVSDTMVSNAAECDFRKADHRGSLAKTAFVVTNAEALDMIGRFYALDKGLKRSSMTFVDLEEARAWLAPHEDSLAV
jgi:hypothetical protein